jgi:hypothetical protein
MATADEVVECGRHGSQPKTFVCQHVVQSLRDGVARGFWWAEDPGNPRPHAWCTGCNQRLARAGGEWTGWAEELAGVTLICGACYDRARVMCLGRVQHLLRRLTGR